MTEIRQTIKDYDNLKDLLIAGDIVVQDVHIVNEADNLDVVMKQFGHTGLDEMPVLGGVNNEQIIGTIWQTDVIAAYNNQIFLRDMTGEVGQMVDRISEGTSVHVVEQYYFFEIEAPPLLTGKNLLELNVRKTYKLEILLIKRLRHTKDGQEVRWVHPNAQTTLRTNDVLLLFGAQADIEHFKKARPV